MSLRLEGVVKRYGRTTAVAGVTLEVGEGEFLALLGPSGCGKTTTLRIVAGLERPDEGRVYIGGRDVTGLEPGERDVAMVFQDYALYPHMTVFQNIAFPLEVRRRRLGLSRGEIARRVREAAEMLGIADLLDKKASQLSGGQQQRVALARALVRRPKVWLMDEPLSNLDALLRLQVRAELKRLQRELAITTVYVTHDQAEAMSMADRIAVMNAGRVVQVGTPHEIYHSPRHLFVATFVGTPPMNLIRCAAKDGLLLCGGFARRAPPGVEGQLYLGVRPEHLRIGPAGAAGRVYVVEPLGPEHVVTVEVEGHLLKVRHVGELGLSPNDPVHLEVDWTRAHLFDPQTGALLEKATEELRRAP